MMLVNSGFHTRKFFRKLFAICSRDLKISPVLPQAEKVFSAWRGVILLACLEHPHQPCFERCTSSMFFQTAFWNWISSCCHMWRKEISWGMHPSGIWRCFICQKNWTVVPN